MGILGEIAQGPSRSLMQGIGMGRQISNDMFQRGLVRDQQAQAQQLAMQQQSQMADKSAKEHNNAMIYKAGLDTVASFGMPYEDRVKFLKSMAEKNENQGMKNLLNTIANSSEKGIDKKTIQAMNAFQQLGVLKGSGPITKAGLEGGTPDIPVEKTTLQKNLEAAGFEPGSPEYQKAIRQKLLDPKTKDDKLLFEQSAKLRGEINKASETYDKITDAFGRIQASVDEPSASGDLALIFNFMKMLDPGSVVREGEFATAQNAAGITDRIRNQYNKILRGERMNPNQRRDFITRSQKIYDEASGRHNVTMGNFVSLGKRFGISRDDIIVERGTPQQVNRPNEPVESKRGQRTFNIGDTGQPQETPTVLNFDAQGNLIQ